MSAALILLVIVAVVILLGLVGLVLPGVIIIGACDVGVLIRKNFGRKLPEGHIIATNGEIGIQSATLLPGLYWRFPILWSVRKTRVLVVEPGKIGIIKSVDGKALLPGRLLGDEVECDSFQDAKKFLASGGFRGPQIGFLRPGTYRINQLVFEIEICDATQIPENKIGVAVALDGRPLPTDFVIAPRPMGEDNNSISDPSFFQDGQGFIKRGGYRGPQLDTLQPGEYYINRLLFDIKQFPLADVPPGYVAVIRSNVGAELEETITNVGTERERLLITDKYKRGIWKEPVAPGKYNLNTLAYTPYLVPTSAVTIDWAAAGKIGTDVKGATNEGVLYKFDPLKVTSKDGFQLEVNVRMIIRVTPENAAFIVARFGSVDNLIDQIVHPLIDSSFRNRAGEKKAIDFFQSRTELQKEALEHAKTVFEGYNVEAQNLLVAYILIPDALLATQTQKEIALQQQEQFRQQAAAQIENINVQEQTARAGKQGDVIAARLQVGIKSDLADARIREAQGESAFLEQTNAATGKGLAQGYEAQKNALGAEGTALVNIIKVLAEKGLKFVPEVVVGGDSSGGLGGLIGILIAKYGKDLAAKEPPA